MALGGKIDDLAFPSRTLRRCTHGKGSPAVHLSLVSLPSAALTVGLLLSVQRADSGEEGWGVGAWQHDEGSGYDAGYGTPGVGPFDRDRRVQPVAGPSAVQFRSPSWSYGDGPIPGSDAADFSDVRQGHAVDWGQDGPYGYQPQGAPGAYLGSGAYPGLTAGPSWQGPADYHQAYGGYVFRPWDQSDGLKSDPGQRWPAPESPREGAHFEGLPFQGPPFQQVSAGYRFRGDPPGSPGQWASAPHLMGYRFRPLTDQEQPRPGLDFESRAGYPTGAGGHQFRGDPMLEPEAAYGFEPNPWQGR